MDYLTEQFPDRHEDTLSPEAQNDLFEYYVEKSKRPHDYFYREADMISGSADYQESDVGQPIEEKDL